MGRVKAESDDAGVLDPPLLAPGRVFGGRYRLEHSIGRGGMAAVWLATDERLGRPVAVKVLSDTVADDVEYLRRFSREARLAAGLQHPNLVRVYDFDAGVRPYLVMEYIDGGTLAEQVESGRQPPIERLARELLSALRHIHAAGVLHRDVKPQNVLLDRHEHARLSDFGIALPRDGTSLTGTGRVLGTESYLAPELLRGEPASERSDLYALGMVLADSVRGSGGDAPLWGLIDRLRDRDPEMRPASAAIALADLERSEHRELPGEATRTLDAPLATPPPPPRVRERTPVRWEEPGPPSGGAPPTHDPDASRRRWVAAGALGAAALLAVGVLAFAGGDDGGSERGGGGAGGEGQAEAEATNAGDGGGSDPAEAEPVAPPAPAPEESGDGGESGGVAADGADAPADGVALNDEGKGLIDSGDPEAAIPVLEQAVAALEDSGDELTLNYALFNLGNALRLAGRPEEAIQYLERRLAFPDQREAVAAELAAAQQAAGIEPDGGPPYGNAFGQDEDD